MLTHIDENGDAVMVDVTDKEVTQRTARAGGRIYMSREALSEVLSGTNKKGSVLGTARVAGIMAVKRTSELIPLCHTLLITKAEIELVPDEESSSVYCECTVKLTGKTGAEMEALTGVSVALLTIYDMCKAVSKDMTITDICLLEKNDGKTGHYVKG
ncbi:MAG: cyclic pyranopterin monophosphate synthase MoaC [Lachnospiraceae bacterium]|nr:cyclic pyranopterin monophosphate synthase MoaC [Lachnospiraceae bacterium]